MVQDQAEDEERECREWQDQDSTFQTTFLGIVFFQMIKFITHSIFCLDQLLIYHLKALFMLFHLNYGKLVKSTYGGVVSLDVLTLVDHFFKKICNRLGNFHNSVNSSVVALVETTV